MSHESLAASEATHHLLIMAYGGPDKLEDVRPYLLDVRNYRPTSDEVVAEITERYEQIGGRSPILELTRAEAAGIETALNELAPEDERWKVWVAMRHWHPFIKDVLAEMEAAGVERAVGLVMAPHYSYMSIGAYFKRIEEAGSSIDIAPVKSWNLNPGYLDGLHDRIADALEKFPAEERGDVPIIFTAHSLPERILERNDPYPDELQATVDALVERMPGREWHWAYQSAAMTADPWLGPDASEVIAKLNGEGKKNVLICPVGFICEHVEILFDIDVEFRQQAEELGMHLERIEMLNDHPSMLTGLAQVARGRAIDAGWVNA
ncbi:MAG TPA: ferrochelatase [Thermomicrobiales bacterium]|nr:ferrochelatase [Thermomicrobiales bacterium]